MKTHPFGWGFFNKNNQFHRNIDRFLSIKTKLRDTIYVKFPSTPVCQRLVKAWINCCQGRYNIESNLNVSGKELKYYRFTCSEVTNQLNEYITKYFLYTLNDSQNKTCTTMKIEKKNCVCTLEELNLFKLLYIQFYHERKILNIEAYVTINTTRRFIYLFIYIFNMHYRSLK